MPNHLHLVVQQGERPLAALMQPLLRRLALMLQHAHGLEGPMFWRHYASVPCLDPVHARNAIVYTHLNPVRAQLCTEPEEYAWTSHTLYAGAPGTTRPLEVERLGSVLDPSLAMPLFATGQDLSAERLRDDYRAFIARRLRADRSEDDLHMASHDRVLPAPPGVIFDTAAWGRSLSPLFHSPLGRGAVAAKGWLSPQRTPDLAALARDTLAVEAPGVALASIRGRRGGRERSRLRHLVIRRLHAAGYRNVQIARYLDISESTVSKVVCAPRPLPPATGA